MILVLGQNGQLALELARRPSLRPMQFAGHKDTDLSQAGAALELIERVAPSAVINAAAHTAVDAAETDEAAAWALNAQAPAEAARACARLGIPLVHVSTDYVFDGTKSGPYLESDPIAPLGAYGRSKAEGEAEVIAAGGRAAIIRTAWVYSPFGKNFVKTMLRLAETRDEVGVVADQVGSPTHAQDLAMACQKMVYALLRDPGAKGIYHYAGAGEAVWADVATVAFEASAKHGGPTARVKRIATVDYPSPARRPANSRLATGRIEALGIPTRDWRARVESCVAELLAK